MSGPAPFKPSPSTACLYLLKPKSSTCAHPQRPRTAHAKSILLKPSTLKLPKLVQSKAKNYKTKPVKFAYPPAQFPAPPTSQIAHSPRPPRPQIAQKKMPTIFRSSLACTARSLSHPSLQLAKFCQRRAPAQRPCQVIARAHRNDALGGLLRALNC